MKIQGVKNCLKILAKSILRFEQEDLSPKIQKSEEGYKRVLADVNSTDEDEDRAYERFNKATGKWFAFHEAIEKMEDVFYSVFTEEHNGGRKLDYKLLSKVMHRLPSDEARHLLVLAIKHYSLSRKNIDGFENIINQEQDENKRLETTLQKVVVLGPKTRTISKGSLSQYYRGKEVLTFKEMKKVTHMLNIKTLTSVVL